MNDSVSEEKAMDMLADICTDVPEEKTYSIDDLFADESQQTPEQPKEAQGDGALGLGSDIDVMFPELKTRPTLEHECAMWDSIDAFSAEVWTERHKGLTLPWPNMDVALNGLQTGFHIIAGDSNHGKSGFLSALEVGLIESNPNSVYILSFSLDDPFEDKLSRIAAILGSTTINFVKNPQRYNINQADPNDIWFQKWQYAVAKTKAMTSQLAIFDSTKGSDVEMIEKRIVETLAALQKTADANGTEPRKLVVTIDNFHDLSTTAPEAQGSDKSKYEYLAAFISDRATKYKIPIICTAELKKLNGHRRPMLDDIKESSKIKYEAKSIMLVYNEVSVKGEAAPIFFTVQGQTGKRPVFEVSYAKNKYGAYKGRHYFLFQPEYVRFVPANDENERKWNSKIYG